MFLKKSLFAAGAAAMMAGGAYAADSLTIAIVNNGHMINMQKVAKEYTAETGVNLNWVSLEEGVLREQVTSDTASGGGQYDSEISWAMYDYTGTVLLDGGAPYEGCLGDCSGGDECLPGDNNDDESINVQDIILVVNYIMGVSTDDLPCADMNGDGTINVQDIVSIVNIIMGTSARVDSATEATLVIRNNDLLLRSDGFIQGVQLILSHGADFTITLEDEYVSEYVTSENQTRVVLVTDGLNTLEKIGDTRGNYTILSSVVSDNNGNSILTNQTTEISDFMLSEAYPNPFNPTTNLSLVLSEAGYVSVKIYNIVGQQVAVLAEGMYEANVNGHQLTWDASNVSSGVYIVRAESLGKVSTQKLMLLK